MLTVCVVFAHYIQEIVGSVENSNMLCFVLQFTYTVYVNSACVLYLQIKCEHVVFCVAVHVYFVCEQCVCAVLQIKCEHVVFCVAVHVYFVCEQYCIADQV